jgi:hypothetical protein
MFSIASITGAERSRMSISNQAERDGRGLSIPREPVFHTTI